MGHLYRFGFHRSALALIACSLLVVGRVAAQTEPMPSSTAEPTGVLHLSDARALALARSPTLKAHHSRATAAAQRTWQAGILPNPEIGLEIENFAGSRALGGFDAAETTVSLGQPVQLGGKRRKRRDIASLDEDRIRLEYAAAKLSLLREVDSPFVALLATQRIRLARTRGSAQPSFGEAQGDLRAVAPPPPLISFLENLDETPEIARWNAQVSRQHAQLELEEAKAYPDIVVSAAMRRLSETDDYAAVFGLTVPMPLFDRNQGNAAAASHLLRAAQHQALANRIRIESSLATAHRDLATAYESSLRLRDVLIPKATEAFAGTQRSFKSGRLRYTDVLDTQRTLFSLELSYIDALVAYHVARAELEQLATRRLPPEHASFLEKRR